MKFNKIFNLLAAGLATLGLSSCMESVEYTPAEPVSLAPYYFSTGNPTQQSLDDGQSSFSLLLGRIDTKGPLEVKITHNPEIDGLFEVPKSAKFADGEGTTTIDVTFDVANLERRKEYVVKLAIDGIQNTPYYLGSIDVTAVYNPWINLGKGIYHESFLATFGIDPSQYPVDIQEHPDTPGIYRMVNPYKPGICPVQMNYGQGDYYITFDARNKKGVFVLESNTGASANPEYGNIIFSSVAYDEMGEDYTEEDVEEQIEAGNCGELNDDGQVIIPAKKVLVAMSTYQQGAFGFNPEEDFIIIMPGGKPFSDWEEVGMCDFTDGFCGPYLATPVLNNKYKVLVERHKKERSLYRIVDPFGPESGYTTSLPQETQYITFDVSEPKCVLLSEPVATLRKRVPYGTVLVTTEANKLLDEGLTVPEIVDAGIGGTFENNVITIPADQLSAYWSNRPATAVEPAGPVSVVLDLNTAPVNTPEAK